MKDRGYTLQDNEAEQLVSHLDTDYSGQVDYLDWLAAMIDWHKVCTWTSKASHDNLILGQYIKPKIDVAYVQHTHVCSYTMNTYLQGRLQQISSINAGVCCASTEIMHCCCTLLVRLECLILLWCTARYAPQKVLQ